MSKKYKLQNVINDRYVVSYMETPKDKSKIGVWKIVDVYLASKPTRYAFRWRVKGKDKTQEQLDEQILENAIRGFNNKSRGNRFDSHKSQAENA